MSKGNGSNAASARCRRSCRRARSATSPAAAGPAASSVIVTADTATCSGSTSAAILSRSITTDVSSKPRGPRSATRIDVLIDYLVQIPAHQFPVEARCVAEHLDGGHSGHEAMAAQRTQLAHRTAIAAHHETPALIERTHNATAVISQLPLTDLLAHATTVALSATHESTARRPTCAVPTLGFTGWLLRLEPLADQRELLAEDRGVAGLETADLQALRPGIHQPVAAQPGAL